MSTPGMSSPRAATSVATIIWKTPKKKKEGGRKARKHKVIDSRLHTQQNPGGGGKH